MCIQGIVAALVLLSLAGPVAAQDAAQKPSAEPAVPDTWIFSGVLDGGESYSGTLVVARSDTQFEMRLGGGASCDGGGLQPSLGLMRLTEIRCTDGRSLRTLFVPQPKQTLKVFGHVGEARFDAVAHLLGVEPPAEPAPSLAPHAPVPAPR